MINRQFCFENKLQVLSSFSVGEEVEGETADDLGVTRVKIGPRVINKKPMPFLKLLKAL